MCNLFLLSGCCLLCLGLHSLQLKWKTEYCVMIFFLVYLRVQATLNCTLHNTFWLHFKKLFKTYKSNNEQWKKCLFKSLRTLFTARAILSTRADTLAVVWISNHSSYVDKRAAILAHCVTSIKVVSHVSSSTIFKPGAFWNIANPHYAVSISAAPSTSPSAVWPCCPAAPRTFARIPCRRKSTITYFVWTQFK